MLLVRSRTVPWVAGALLVVVAAASVRADERKQPRPDIHLPGVDRSVGTSSVTTLAEPDDALPAGSRPGSFRVGDWDVTISGSISYEIGTGRPHDGR